ncbi:hypothetical protein Tco_0034280 [Tanacetum coccineum]
MHNNIMGKLVRKIDHQLLWTRQIFNSGDHVFYDDIYSTVDACNTANEMWIAIERLQQGESLNVQDVKTNLFWEFGKFTSQDGESMESYYSRFYKLMNELTRNNLQVTTMQVNVQISSTTTTRMQFQLEVNDIRAERIAKSANPLALIAAAQPCSDTYYQAPKPLRSNATSSSTRQTASTRHKGKEVAKPNYTSILSLSLKETLILNKLRGKEMQKNLALLAKYFKKLYKPTNNNLRTSSNSKNKTEDTTPRYNNDNQSRQFGNQRTMTGAGARETVGSQAAVEEWTRYVSVQQEMGICKGIAGTKAGIKTTLNHKEKMMMCIQDEKATWQKFQDFSTEEPVQLSAIGTGTKSKKNKQNEFEKYKDFNDRTIDYEILQTKLNETLGLLALKDIEIKEGLKTKAYEISVLNQKHDELVKKSLLTKSQLEGYLKENTKVISDLKVKEEKDIDKMIEMDKHTFKKAQSDKPCLYEIPYDTSDPANRFAPDREGTMTLDNESRSKLNKDFVKPYDYTKQNSLYEIFKGPSLEYLYQLERGKEVKKTMWRKPFVRTKPKH